MFEQFGMDRGRFIIASDGGYKELQVKNMMTSKYYGETAMYI